jgi:aminotransferase
MTYKFLLFVGRFNFYKDKEMFQRTQNINLSPIKTMELLASKIPDVVSLAQGIPSFDTPEIVKKAAVKALNRGVVAKYSLTYGLLELRETIEQKLAEDGMFYDFEKEIIAVAGSIEGITATLIAAIESEKDEVVIFSPDYTSYAEAIKVAGGKPVYVNLIENEGWRIDLNSLKQKIGPRTAAIMFSNPNNPSGAIFPKKDLLAIAELAKQTEALIISDEVYKDFVYNDADKIEIFSLAQIPELRKKVIRIFSLSKAYAMAGWRIGFLHSDEENIKEILKIHDSLVTCAPVIAQHAAMAALDYGDSEVAKFVSEFYSRREIMCAYFDEMKDFFEYQKPNGSYFVFPKMKQIDTDFSLINTNKMDDNLRKKIQESDSWRFALELLYNAHVVVVPGLAFGPAGENHVRMSFGRSRNDIKEGMERIMKYLSKN